MCLLSLKRWGHCLEIGGQSPCLRSYMTGPGVSAEGFTKSSSK
jgi:hypothetical protein